MSSSQDGPDRRRNEDASASRRQGDPEWIGAYHLLEVLGEGGMGTVYLAEQTTPVQRRVALKIIKLGMDTHEVVHRFESERQALAVVDHPNIAQVLDGGATDNGRPYFVMELVRGVPITDYADTHRLSTHERLRLFLDVCAAVQHAHLKGVIHRDLKPSNVMVTVQESRPLVKVIDFGVAKAIGRPLIDDTLVTQIGQMVGTPEYMSPEQAEMSGLDVDTRTDVYSLGVVLYELIVGALPFDLATRPERAIPHALRERDTPRPSVRLSSLGPQRTVVAERRRTTPDSLRRQLKGDLDWIILKAMDKDRTRRYDTPHGLALDLQRHLAHEPVLARPPSAGYRTAKFIQRHRAGVAAATIAVVALIAGAAAATAGFVKARRAEEIAKTEAQTAQQTASFLESLFDVSDPSEARGSTVTAREILDRGAEKIGTDLADQPDVQARMMRTIGSVYTKLGLYDQARGLLQKAVALDRSVGDQKELTASLVKLGVLDGNQGYFDDADRELEEALELSTRLYGSDDSLVASVTAVLGNLYVKNYPARAVPLLRRALELYGRAEFGDSITRATVLTNLGTAFSNDHQPDSASHYLRRALDVRTRLLPSDDPRLGSSWLNLGVNYYYQGRYAEAADAYENAHRIIEKVYGPDHPNVAAALTNVAEVYWLERRYDDAERDFIRALDIQNRALTPDNPDLAVTVNGLANVYRDEGKYTAADSLYRRAIEIREKLGPHNEYLGQSLSDYADLLDRMGRPTDAKEMRARAEKIRSAKPAS
ncbi:MAG: serine/threonine-protein kinase [Gemmatimonadetes bacterium]|nr:serine/threonine-protein kinase [Gemmatimonadota bacterium]